MAEESKNPLAPYRGNILPLEYSPEAGYSLAMPKFLLDMWESAKLPGRILQGQVAPTVEDAGKFVLDWMIGAPLAVGAAPKGVAGDALLGTIKGYHGTPYRFEAVEHNPFGEFKNEAIGSGEGAQAYGYGHYVAGKQGVAEFYRDALSDRVQKLILDDVEFDLGKLPDNLSDVERTAISEIADNFSIGQDPLESARNAVKSWEEDGFIFTDLASQEEKNTYQYAKDVLAQVEDFMSRGARLGDNQEKSLYTVEIGVEPEQLLDWDSAVDNSVWTRAIDKARELYPNRNEDWSRFEQITPRDKAYYSGNRLYKDFADILPVAKVSQLFHAAEIPGIKYLDQGSRKFDPQQLETDIAAVKINLETAKRNVAGASSEFKPGYEKDVERHQKTLKYLEEQLAAGPTYNYVIFDPKNLKITARNGVPLERVDHDPFKTQGD